MRPGNSWSTKSCSLCSHAQARWWCGGLDPGQPNQRGRSLAASSAHARLNSRGRCCRGRRPPAAATCRTTLPSPWRNQDGSTDRAAVRSRWASGLQGGTGANYLRVRAAVVPRAHVAASSSLFPSLHPPLPSVRRLAAARAARDAADPRRPHPPPDCASQAVASWRHRRGRLR